MNKLLIIDAQNDFLDIDGAALAVPGALADIQRLTTFLTANTAHIQSISLTLDSHPAVAIERPGFWQTGSGADVAPLTPIKREDVVAGAFLPRNAAFLPDVLAYLTALELGGKHTLMVWPPHCVLGTWGHAMPTLLTDALAAWEVAAQTAVYKVLKGLNPMTEQYSAIQAEVPVAGDDRTLRNYALVEAVTPIDGILFVAGEALSHCVRATVLDLFEGFTRAQVERTVLLSDCMSPVGGFERNAGEFLGHMRHCGAKTLTSAQATELLRRP